MEERGIPGEILTTNYLDFSEPKALSKLNEYSNITIKMYDVNAANTGFHTKGYIFRKGEIYRIILGSSNMTGKALQTNNEWNTKLVSTSRGEVAAEIVEKFIVNLRKLMLAGNDRALLISATGARHIIMTGRKAA